MQKKKKKKKRGQTISIYGVYDFFPLDLFSFTTVLSIYNFQKTTTTRL